MDTKNRKILRELVLNSRMPINRLARRVGLSREVVTYRINKLEREGIITNFHAIIDEEALGFSRNTFFLQLKGISLKEEKEFLNFLTKHKAITYSGTVIGKWNVVFDIISKNRMDLENVISEIKRKAKDFLSIFAMAGNTISGGYYPEKIFGSREKELERANKLIKVDRTDLKILKLLSTNSRIEYSDLAREINLSANAIKYRIKRLEETKVVLGYTISTNIKKLGYNWYNIQTKLVSDEKEVKEFLKKNKMAIYHYHYIGNENWDVDIGIIVRDPEELRDFIVQFREKLGDRVKIHDVYIVLDVLKENIAPEIMFE